jgi:hypothetical protein
MFGTIGSHVGKLVMVSFSSIFFLRVYSTQNYSINDYVTLKYVSFTTQNIWPLLDCSSVFDMSLASIVSDQLIMASRSRMLDTRFFENLFSFGRIN